MATTRILAPVALAHAEQAADEPDALLAAGGDADSFRRLYQRYRDPVYRYLVARLAHAHDAEEATAIVFERAWTSLPRYKPAGPFAGWLFTIARRVLADHYRRSAGRKPAAPLHDGISDPADPPEQAFLRDEKRRELLAAVAQLGAEQQEIIALRFFAELPYTTIASIVGKKEAAVKMAAYRALETLKGRIDHD